MKTKFHFTLTVICFLLCSNNLIGQKTFKEVPLIIQSSKKNYYYTILEIIKTDSLLTANISDLDLENVCFDVYVCIDHVENDSLEYLDIGFLEKNEITQEYDFYQYYDYAWCNYITYKTFNDNEYVCFRRVNKRRYKKYYK